MDEKKPRLLAKLGDYSLFFMLALCGLLVWFIPEWLLSGSGRLPVQSQITATNELRLTLLIIFGTVLFAGLVLVLFRKLPLFEEFVAAQRDNLLTDRFSKAVEQLGTYKVEVQLGGIFSLERIAVESEKEHWTIMEILTAYVRENAQWSGRQHDPDSHPDEVKEPDKSTKAATDIQAIMTVLGRRAWTDQELEHGKILNLRMTNLRYVDLRGANLRYANLRGVNFEGANLMEADLTGAFLGEANLRNCNLAKANLTGSTFMGANLNGANLKGCIIENTTFTRASLKGARLIEATLDAVDFSGANLEEADLGGVALNRVTLKNAKLNHSRYDYATSFPEWLSEDRREALNMEFTTV